MQKVTATADIHEQGAITGRLTWHRLLSATAAADVVAILASTAWRGDPEAAAIAAGFAAGLTLLRWRTGLAGKLLLAVLFADVVGWMALGTITNIGAGEQLGAVLIPATLSGISVTGLIAAVVNLRVGVASGAAIAAGFGVTVVVAAAIAAVQIASALRRGGRQSSRVGASRTAAPLPKTPITPADHSSVRYVRGRPGRARAEQAAVGLDTCTLGVSLWPAWGLAGIRAGVLSVCLPQPVSAFGSSRRVEGVAPATRTALYHAADPVEATPARRQ
jgi:hypothetical protein